MTDMGFIARGPHASCFHAHWSGTYRYQEMQSLQHLSNKDAFAMPNTV